MVLAEEGQGGTRMSTDNNDSAWVVGCRNWEEMKKNNRPEDWAFLGMVVFLILTLSVCVFFSAANASVDIYLKLKNGGDRKVHAVEVVK
jgi:uncharacterized membrane protein